MSNTIPTSLLLRSLLAQSPGELRLSLAPDTLGTRDLLNCEAIRDQRSKIKFQPVGFDPKGISKESEKPSMVAFSEDNHRLRMKKDPSRLEDRPGIMEIDL
uniref:Uncharacterized protein n=1 Tax=Pristionchus pacificus TaxID=54126 RepID=A0A2A6B5E3_PRIPA|eukprot:PDM61081.1 hypothetical protein PRIPAC_54887 [Pristionchus pacificus]